MKSATLEQASSISASAKGEAGGTVTRVLALLNCFAERPEWSVTELAQRLDLPKSTAHRLLQLCRDNGYIDTQAGGVYSVGVQFSRMAALVAARAPLARFAAPLVQDLAFQCQEVAFIAELVPEKLRMTYLVMADPSEEFHYHIDLHVLKSLCWGGCGRAILAYMPPARVEQAIAEAGDSPSGMPFDEAALRQDLQTVRKRGYYISRAQHRQTAVGVGVPFFGPDGAVKGSLGLSIPLLRFREKMVPGLVKPMMECARKITYFLGGNSEPGVQP
jgi:DNA-binding IclR family transcriptional regulator